MGRLGVSDHLDRALAVMDEHELDLLLLGREANARWVERRRPALARGHAPVRAGLRGRARDRVPSTC